MSITTLLGPLAAAAALVALREERDRLRLALERITRECAAMNKGPTGVKGDKP